VAKGKGSDAEAASDDATRLEIVRFFDAPRKLVFQAWATPEHLNKWSAPEGFTIPEARMDFRKGGTYFAHMRSAAGEDHRVEGKYLDIVEGKRIVMTHAWLDNDTVPGPETTITVTFDDADNNRTRMTFIQEGFSSRAVRDGHGEGWSSCFDLLARLVEKP
jgi:uncharacterized protein YndB with AHSA1/START domain